MNENSKRITNTRIFNRTASTISMETHVWIQSFLFRFGFGLESVTEMNVTHYWSNWMNLAQNDNLDTPSVAFRKNLIRTRPFHVDDAQLTDIDEGARVRPHFAVF